MRMQWAKEWLQNHIENDPDIECDAGWPLRDAAPLKQFVQEEGEAAPEQKMAVLNVLVHQIRRRDGLSIDGFADRIQVESDEIEKLESDPDFVPRPRTLHRLADYLKVPTVAVQSLTADSVVRDDNVTKAALRFAASSDDLTKLSSTERRGLNDFVKFLSTLDNRV